MTSPNGARWTRAACSSRPTSTRTRSSPKAPGRRARAGLTIAAGRTWPFFLLALAIFAALASVELYVVWTHRPGADAPASPPQIAAGVSGSVDVPAAGAMVGPHVVISGWALDPTGIARVELRVGGRTFPARYGVARADVTAVRAGFPDSHAPGFEFEGDIGMPAPPGVDRRRIEVVAIARDGREQVLGARDLVEPAALVRFRDLPAPKVAARFHILPALSAVGLGGARELDSVYAPYLSSTLRTGMRVPILYLRTTRGAAGDYVFDPEWDVERRCGLRRIAEDSLGTTMRYAIDHRLPVLFTLNGGVWADASCDVPAWDVNDHLEENVANCQWNEHDEVMPDDYLRHLAGSQDAPELARSLTFNVYAHDVRRYKRRNLQAAGRMIAAFAREHPDLFVGVNLDPDTYMNPFFDMAQWYDYNPGTLRQFREWLAGTGPYAGRPAPDTPDLSRYRRARPLTLAAVRKLAGRPFARWEDVDPPRVFPREPAGGRPAFWDDPWTREWELFRRHLVDLHYDELSAWLAETGIPAARIWSSQGFMAPHPDALPFAIRLDSPMKNYDTGGMTVAGAVPAHGHLGAILYGAAAANDIRMETPQSLFDTFRRLDPGWAVVEVNTADLRDPGAQPTYAAGYRVLRDVFNYGARFVSPMAWNGSNGALAGEPGYVTFTAWRNTPFEDAARDFMLSHANVPLGARLWTFGSPRHTDADGWTAARGTVVPGPGMVDVLPDRGSVALVSPGELALDPARFASVVVGLEEPARLAGVRIYARRDDRAPWQPVTERSGPFRASGAGAIVPLDGAAGGQPMDRLRIELDLAGEKKARLVRLAVWPR